MIATGLQLSSSGSRVGLLCWWNWSLRSEMPERSFSWCQPHSLFSNIPLRLMNCLFPVPDSQPTATELFQSPLYGSGTVFHSISHLLRHIRSSALIWRHTSSNSVSNNYCCRAGKVTLSFMDTLIALTYLLTYLLWMAFCWSLVPLLMFHITNTFRSCISDLFWEFSVDHITKPFQTVCCRR